MTEDLHQRLAALACEHLRDIAEDFAEEMDHHPTAGELAELLSAGIQSSGEEPLEDIHPRDVVSLDIELASGARANADIDPSEIYGMNDNVFVLASALWKDLADAYRGESGSRPKLEVLAEILVQALGACGDDVLSDIRGADVTKIRPQLRKTEGGPRRKAAIGDIVAIPVPDGDAYHAVVVARNDFGTAYGPFVGVRPVDGFDVSDPPPADPYPVYAADELVATGEWPIVGHDDALLDLFPTEPEIYHDIQLDPTLPEVGPHGSAETPAGEWRDIDEAEAEAVGLADDSYREFFMPQELQFYLKDRQP